MLSRLHVINFRCHKDFELPGLSQFNLFTGANGRGKTSILEAVYFLSRCRSFRTHQPRELIHWGSQQFGIAGWFENTTFKKLKVEWAENERTLAIDNSGSLTFREFWGRAPSVVIQNHDRTIIQDGAQTRRLWVDGLLSSMNAAYLSLIQRAQLLLKHKNALLRQEAPDRVIWDGLTEQLESISREVLQYRTSFTDKAAPLLEKYYYDLTGRLESASIRYDPFIPRALSLSPSELWDRETVRGVAVLGPHRDDWHLSLFDKPLRDFGSEGQVKSAALALRLLESELIHDQTGVWPILLVDDALTDLDPERQRRFWELLPPEAQIMYTSTRSVLSDLTFKTVEINF